MDGRGEMIRPRVFREHGLPDRIRSDNGAPFASTGVAGPSRLAVWRIRLGIQPERIERGKPKQTGRDERMHRTLKQALGKDLLQTGKRYKCSSMPSGSTTTRSVPMKARANRLPASATRHPHARCHSHCLQ